MKKILIIFSAFLVFSCGSVNMAAKYPNMLADVKPFKIETIPVTFDTFFAAKLKINDVDVIFYPRENLVALEFRHELVRYRQFWDPAARRLFIQALELYKTDFEAKNLSLKYNKSRSIYGRFQTKIEWETFKFTATYKAAPIMELGYRFRGESPYFTVLQRSARENSGSVSGSELESLQIPMYYTRAQGETLAQLFDQEYLLGLLNISADTVIETEDDAKNIIGDVY